jgi:ribosomal protein L37AE/L43A
MTSVDNSHIKDICPNCEKITIIETLKDEDYEFFRCSECGEEFDKVGWERKKNLDDH